MSAFVKPFMKYKDMKERASDENLKKKIEWRKAVYAVNKKQWDGKADSWREWISYIFLIF